MCPVFGFLDNPLMILVIGAIAVMLFGERLPEVARSAGKSLMELKNGMRGLQREFEDAVNSATTSTTTSLDTAPRYEAPDDREEATAPKFEPPPSP